MKKMLFTLFVVAIGLSFGTSQASQVPAWIIKWSGSFTFNNCSPPPENKISGYVVTNETSKTEQAAREAFAGIFAYDCSSCALGPYDSDCLYGYSGEVCLDGTWDWGVLPRERASV